MNLSHVVTIGTFRGGSVGGLEEGKGVQSILGRKNSSPNTRSAQSCTQKMRLCFSQIYHHLLKLLTSLFDILQPFSEICSINLKFISLKLMTIFRSEKNRKYLKISRPGISANSNLTRPGFPYIFDHFPIFWARTEHFYQKSQKRKLIVAISPGRGFLMFLTTSQDFW